MHDTIIDTIAQEVKISSMIKFEWQERKEERGAKFEGVGILTKENKMSLFSQRKGIKPLKKEFQREAIDDELKNRLWSALKIIVWDQYLGDKTYSVTIKQVELFLINFGCTILNFL